MCYDEASECATARQHNVVEVACYRPREDTDGVRRPLFKGGGFGALHPICILELTKTEVDRGGGWLGVTELSLAGRWLLQATVVRAWLHAML